MTHVTGQAGDAHAAAVHGLGNDGMAAGGRTDDDVVCFRDTDLEFIDFDFVHLLAVGLDHRHRNAGNTQIEEGHGRPVDDPQTHALTRNERELQIVLRPVAIDEEGIGAACHVGDIARVHPHLAPHAAHGAGHGAFACGQHVALEIVFADLQLAHDVMRMERREFAEQHYVIAVVARIGVGTFDDDRTIVTGLFLQSRV